MHKVKEIYFFVGLPGSGKTTMAQNFLNKKSFFADDLFLVYKDNDKNWAKVFEFDENIERLVFTDVQACAEPAQEFLLNTMKKLFPNAVQHWFFFENNKEQCQKNVIARNDGRNVKPTLDYYSKTYKVSEFIQKNADYLEHVSVYKKTELVFK